MGKAIHKANGEIWLLALNSKALPPLEEGDSIIEVDFDALPDKDFRDCWKVENDAIEIDLPLARAKRLDQLRVERDAQLLELDAEQAQLISIHGDLQHADVQAIFAQKQALRDMPVKAESDLALKEDAALIKSYSLEDALAVEE